MEKGEFVSHTDKTNEVNQNMEGPQDGIQTVTSNGTANK